jgi:dihydrofolate reductase
LKKKIMSKTFIDVAISLDGFMAGDSRSPKNPMGGVAPALHSWMFVQKAFWETHDMEGKGEKDDEDGNLIREVFARTGAWIMGKRMFEEGELAWPEGLFKAPVYVLTHEKRQPWVQKNNTTFYFINDGLQSALTQARAAAGNKDVRISGGGDCIRQALNGGYVDELTTHIAPVLLGGGIPLFEGVDKTKLKFEITRTIHSPMATHVTYKIATQP